MDTLEAVSQNDDASDHGRPSSMARRASLAVLRDLDATLLEQNVVADLLHLGASSEALRQHDDALDYAPRAPLRVDPRAGIDAAPASGVAVYVGGEARPRRSPRATPRSACVASRALLHLVDGDVEDPEGDAARAARLRKRWLRTAKALLGRFERDPPSILRRTILAALARALDALVRAGVCDVSDVLLVVARKMTDPAELDTLAEASMAPDLIHVLKRYAEFVRGASTAGDGVPDEAARLAPPAVRPARDGDAEPARQARGAWSRSSNELSPDASTRTEALRTVIVRLHGPR